MRPGGWGGRQAEAGPPKLSSTLSGFLSSENLGGALSILPTGARKALVLWSLRAETPILWPPDAKNRLI